MSANVEPIFPRSPLLRCVSLFSEDGAVPRNIGTGATPPKVIVEGGDDGVIIGNLFVIPVGVITANIISFFVRGADGQWNLLVEHPLLALTNDSSAIPTQGCAMPQILSPNISTSTDKKNGITLEPGSALGAGMRTALSGAQGLNLWVQGGFY